jgi:hypothetical protein
MKSPKITETVKTQESIESETFSLTKHISGVIKIEDKALLAEIMIENKEQYFELLELLKRAEKFFEKI